MQPTGILIISSSFAVPPNAYHGVSQDLTEELSKNGCRVFTTSAHPNRLLRLFDMLATTFKLRNQYDLAQLDLFSGQAFIWGYVVSWLLTLLGKPFIITLHGGNLPRFAQRLPFAMRDLLRRAHSVTSPSRHMRQQMLPYGGPIHYIPNPLNLEIYPYHQRTEPRPRLVWLRAFHDIYQPTLAVEAMHILKQRGTDVHLTMIGPDKRDGSLQRTVAAIQHYNLNARIELLFGVPKNEVSTWLNKSDIFLNTSRTDNLPVTITEAMACGLVVISTSVGAIPDYLLQSHAGVIVPRNDAAAIADAVEAVLSDTTTAAELSAAARQRAAIHNVERVIPQWLALIQQVT